MTISGPYSTAELLEVSRRIKVTPPFYLNWFTRAINFTTEEIFFDKVSEDYRRLAPLVVPNVQGKLLGVGSYASLSFRPAYVKPKHEVNPDMVMERMAGEALGSGSMSPGQRRDAVVANILRLHREMLTNRNNWLAAKALIDGQVTLVGDDYPSTTVNFQRNAGLTSVLAGAARWSVGTGNPLADIKAMRVLANSLSGQVIKRIVFGATAWGYFTTLVDLKALQDKNFGGIIANVQRMSDGFEGQEYMGTFGGSFGGGQVELWVDTSKYIDEAGSEQYYLDQKTVVGFADVAGIRCFGAIRDLRAGLQPLEMFQKMWQNEDPSAEYILTQSAPLMVPKNPDASFKIVTSD